MADNSKREKWTPERRKAWRKEYMQRYNEKYREKRKARKEVEIQEDFQSKPFEPKARHPHILTLSDVARLLNIPRDEVKKLNADGVIPTRRTQNNYPRLHADDVFRYAEAKGIVTERLIEYKDELSKHVSIKDTDPEKHAELTARLEKARAAKAARAANKKPIPHEDNTE